MPIRPQHRWLYPIDWQQLTDLVRFQRAKGIASIAIVRTGALCSIWAMAGGGAKRGCAGETGAADLFG